MISRGHIPPVGQKDLRSQAHGTKRFCASASSRAAARAIAGTQGPNRPAKNLNPRTEPSHCSQSASLVRSNPALYRDIHWVGRVHARSPTSQSCRSHALPRKLPAMLLRPEALGTSSVFPLFCGRDSESAKHLARWFFRVAQQHESAEPNPNRLCRGPQCCSKQSAWPYRPGRTTPTGMHKISCTATYALLWFQRRLNQFGDLVHEMGFHFLPHLQWHFQPIILVLFRQDHLL